MRAEAFLQKPFGKEALASAVAEAVRPPSEGDAART